MCTEENSVESDKTTSSGNKVTVVKPDHVSLGQCVVHQEFIRKYSSIKDIDILNLLHDGYLYNGFKDLLIESSEQEGFANMHHILMLSSLDKLITKEVCVRRANNIHVNMSTLKTKREVLTDINSVVIIIPDKEVSLYFYYFTKQKKSSFQLDYPGDNFKASLTSDVLTLEFGTHILVLNFRNESPKMKRVDINPDIDILTTSMELLVTSKKSNNLAQLCCDYLHNNMVNDVLVSSEILMELSSSKIITVFAEKIFWICANDHNLSVYALDQHNDLTVQHTVDIRSFFPKADFFTFIDLCYCSTTMQCFLLYLKELNENVSSFITVFDVNKLQVTSLLEMEMTLNRTPDLVMYPLRDGSRLFVQEIFENRVIFYQVFTLLPVDHMLQNLNL